MNFRLVDLNTDNVIDTTTADTLAEAESWVTDHPDARAPWKLEYEKDGEWLLHIRVDGVTSA